MTNPATKTGLYMDRGGGRWFYRAGDYLPDGMTYIDDEPTAEAPAEPVTEQRMTGAAPENRAEPTPAPVTRRRGA